MLSSNVTKRLNAIRTVHRLDARMNYLRLAAYDMALEELREENPQAHVAEVEVTQLGRTGFHFRHGRQIIAVRRDWPDYIVEANAEYF